MSYIILAWIAPGPVQVFFHNPTVGFLLLVADLCIPLAIAVADRALRNYHRNRQEEIPFLATYETIADRLCTVRQQYNWYAPATTNKLGVD